MKKNISIFLLSCCAFSVDAQITLTQSNTPHNSNYQYSGIYNTAGVTIPTEGANETFDYSNLPAPTGFQEYNYLAPTRAGFTSYTRYFVGESQLANIPLFSEYYTEVNANGIYKVGSYKLTQSVNLASITGSTNDSIFFPGGSNIHTTPIPVLTFPTNYGDSETSNAKFQTDFNLTAGAFGLSQTPGVNQQDIEILVETVGYGNLTLPMGTGKSIPYNVLLVKSQYTVIDSVFLGGAPAPLALLNAFGLVQGDTTYENHYFFYGEGFEEPIFSMKMSEDWTTVLFSDYDTTNLQRATPAGISSNESFEQVSIYPNPSNGILHIKTAFDYQNMEVSIFNLIGEKILSINNQSTIDTHTLSVGTYFIKYEIDNIVGIQKFIKPE